MITSSEILNKVEEIPPLPGAVVELINVLNNPSSSVREIVQVIQYDQALTTQMLRMCNSAYFGLSRSISSLEDAIRILGTTKVMQLVLTINTSSLLNHAHQGYGMHAGALWRHSVAVAIASSFFGEKIGLERLSLAFTGGLLHDIGKLVLDKYVGEEFEAIVKKVSDEKLGFEEAERFVLGFSHADIGERLADRWNLPQPIVTCIRYHHSPLELDAPDPLVDSVYLGNSVCLLMGIGLGEDALFHRAHAEVMERHDLHEQDLETVGAKVMKELVTVENAYGVAQDDASEPAPTGGGA